MSDDNNAEKVKVRWYCGCYVGPARWHGTEDYEPNECDCTHDTVETKEDYDEGDLSTECPACGEMLCQMDGHIQSVTPYPDAESARI